MPIRNGERGTATTSAHARKLAVSPWALAIGCVIAGVTLIIMAVHLPSLTEGTSDERSQRTPSSAPGDRPSAVNTGVEPGVRLAPSGSLTVRKDGTVLENLDVRGSITVAADDVTIRNVRVRSNSRAYGINVAQGYGGTLIEHVEVQMGVGGTSGNGAIGGMGDHVRDSAKEAGDNVTVRHSYIHGIADGIKAANYGLYEHNYIRMRRAAGSVKHIDGIQASGRTDWTARYNWIDQAYSGGHNSAIFLQSYTGATDTHVYNVVMEKNWVNGGVYTLHFGDGKKAPGPWLHNIIVRDNIFYRDYKYGVFNPRGDVHAGGGVYGGVWADTGKAVPRGRIH
jgi:hypothetical protein